MRESGGEKIDTYSQYVRTSMFISSVTFLFVGLKGSPGEYLGVTARVMCACLVSKLHQLKTEIQMRCPT